MEEMQYNRPVLLMPVDPSPEDSKIYDFVNSTLKLEVKNIYSVGDIDSAFFYPDGLLGLRLNKLDEIRDEIINY